jgi:hypothetical protein
MTVVRTDLSRTQAVLRPRRNPSNTSRSRLLSAKVTAMVAWIGLLLLSWFLWSKIDFNTQGTGWLLLPAFGLCVALVVLSRVSSGERFLLSRSFTCTAIFVLYFLVRLALDSETASDFMGYSFAYTTGLLFALLLGLAVRLLLEAVSDSAAGGWQLIGQTVFLGANLLFALRVEVGAADAGDVHPMYALIRNETYQVSGVMASWIAVTSSAAVVLSECQAKRNWLTLQRGMLLGMLGLGFAALVRLTQLMGSNAGPAFIVPLSLLVFAIMLTPFGKQVSTRSHVRLVVKRVGFWRRGRVVLGICMGASIALAVTVWAVVAWDAIDVTRYRAFGFEQSTLANTSVTSRFEILMDNFGRHFSHAPLLGDMFVDSHTTGRGSYLHSLLAVLPHLGIVGTLMFFAMLIAMGLQLWSAWGKAQGSPRDQRFAMLAIAATTWTLVYALMATSFTNGLLWFVVGLFVPLVHLSRASRASAEARRELPSLE